MNMFAAVASIAFWTFYGLAAAGEPTREHGPLCVHPEPPSLPRSVQYERRGDVQELFDRISAYHLRSQDYRACLDRHSDDLGPLRHMRLHNASLDRVMEVTERFERLLRDHNVLDVKAIPVEVGR